MPRVLPERCIGARCPITEPDRHRHVDVLRRCWCQNYLAQGKKGMARKDLERIFAEDSDYPNVREELAKLSA